MDSRWQRIQWLKHRPATPPHPHHTHRFKLQGTQYLLSQMLAPINTSLPQVFAKWGCQILYFLIWLCCFVMTHKWLKKHPGTDWECMSCWIANVASWPGVSWSALAGDKTRAIWWRGHQLNDLPSFFKMLLLSHGTAAKLSWGEVQSWSLRSQALCHPRLYQQQCDIVQWLVLKASLLGWHDNWSIWMISLPVFLFPTVLPEGTWCHKEESSLMVWGFCNHCCFQGSITQIQLQREYPLLVNVDEVEEAK